MFLNFQNYISCTYLEFSVRIIYKEIIPIISLLLPECTKKSIQLSTLTLHQNK